MLSTIGAWLLGLIEQIGYQGIAFAMFLENVFPPIPSELIMPFGGFLAGEGRMVLVGVIVAGVVGTYFGVLPFYLLGYWLHKDKLLKLTDRRGGYLGLTREEIEKAFVAFHRYGSSFVLFGRFIPIFRTIISFPAGAVRMNFFVYSIYTILGTAIWCSLLATVGYVLGTQRERVGVIMKEYEHVMLAAIALIIVVYFGNKIAKKKSI